MPNKPKRLLRTDPILFTCSHLAIFAHRSVLVLMLMLVFSFPFLFHKEKERWSRRLLAMMEHLPQLNPFAKSANCVYTAESIAGSLLWRRMTQKFETYSQHQNGLWSALLSCKTILWTEIARTTLEKLQKSSAPAPVKSEKQSSLPPSTDNVLKNRIITILLFNEALLFQYLLWNPTVTKRFLTDKRKGLILKIHKSLAAPKTRNQYRESFLGHKNPWECYFHQYNDGTMKDKALLEIRKPVKRVSKKQKTDGNGTLEDNNQDKCEKIPTSAPEMVAAAAAAATIAAATPTKPTAVLPTSATPIPTTVPTCQLKSSAIIETKPALDVNSMNTPVSEGNPNGKKAMDESTQLKDDNATTRDTDTKTTKSFGNNHKKKRKGSPTSDHTDKDIPNSTEKDMQSKSIASKNDTTDNGNKTTTNKSNEKQMNNTNDKRGNKKQDEPVRSMYYLSKPDRNKLVIRILLLYIFAVEGTTENECNISRVVDCLAVSDTDAAYLLRSAGFTIKNEEASYKAKLELPLKLHVPRDRKWC